MTCCVHTYKYRYTYVCIMLHTHVSLYFALSCMVLFCSVSCCIVLYCLLLYCLLYCAVLYLLHCMPSHCIALYKKRQGTGLKERPPPKGRRARKWNPFCAVKLCLTLAHVFHRLVDRCLTQDGVVFFGRIRGWGQLSGQHNYRNEYVAAG